MPDENASLGELLGEVRDLKSAVVALSGMVRSQEGRLARLEGIKVATHEVRESEPVSMGYAPVPPPPPQYQASGAMESLVSSSQEPKITVGEWFGTDWPMKVGAFLILLGFGWFVSYAFMNNWIGPVGRIALGIAAGVLLLAFGYFRMGTSLNQGGVLLGLGTATTLLTVFAAREIYDFFTPTLAVVFMSLVVVFTAYSSLVSKSRAIAFMSLVAGAIAPLLAAGESNFLGLFSYLFLLSAGTLWVVRLTAWRALTFTSLLFVALYSLPFIATGLGRIDRGEALLVAAAFAALYFVTGLLGTLKDRMVERSDLFVVALNGFLLLGWIHSFVPETYQSLAAVLAAVVFSVAATLVYRATGIASPVYLYAGNAAVFLVVATAYELSGSAFVTALALEVGLVIAGSYFVTRKAQVADSLGWLMVLPVLFSLGSMGAYARVRMNSPVFTEEFFALLTVAIVAGAIGYLYRISRAESVNGNSVFSARALTVLSILYGIFLVWYGAKRAIGAADMAVFAALTIYTLVGIALYLKGRLTDDRELRLYGSGFLILVAVRLLVEAWHMDIFGRIITFFVIGGLFMSTAFLGKKKAVSTIAGLLVFASVLATHSVHALNNAPLASPESSLSAFEYVGAVTLPVLKTPSVVEVPVSDPAFRQGNFAVWEGTAKTFQPTAYRSVSRSVPVEASAQTGEGNPGNLVDRNYRTSVSFPVSSDGGANAADILLHAAKPISLSGITLELDRYVSLPTSVEVHLVDGGRDKVVLAKTSMRDRTVRFPRETGLDWSLRFIYTQPLRISEISLADEGRPLTESEVVRFLARPGETYAIYFGADRPLSASVGEAPNLLDNRDVVSVSMGGATPNPLYAPADTDSDGVRDLLDNCVSIANPDQLDANGNGRGDVCDDYDKDGIVNSSDTCPDFPNRNQADTDGDGIGDACDHEESRITEKYQWLPWVAMVLSGFVVAGLFAATVRRERNKK
jgi:hypothetical protein